MQRTHSTNIGNTLYTYREHVLHIENTFYMSAGDILTCGSAGFLLGCSIQNTCYIDNTFYMAV
jgi:hypothetical protein